MRLELLVVGVESADDWAQELAVVGHLVVTVKRQTEWVVAIRNLKVVAQVQRLRPCHGNSVDKQRPDVTLLLCFVKVVGGDVDLHVAVLADAAEVFPKVQEVMLDFPQHPFAVGHCHIDSGAAKGWLCLAYLAQCAR